MPYSLISKKGRLQTKIKPQIPHTNPITNYPMFILYSHVDSKDNKVLATHNKLICDDHEIVNYYSTPYPYEINDIFFVHMTIPHYELNGSDVGGTLEFDFDINRLEVDKIYKIPFEEKIHSFILREDGMLDYYIHE